MYNTGKLPIVFGILFTRDKILQKKAKKRVVRAKPKDRWIIEGRGKEIRRWMISMVSILV